MPALRSTILRRIVQPALVASLLIGALIQAYRFWPTAPQTEPNLQTLPALAAGGDSSSRSAPKDNNPPAIEGWVTDAVTGEPVATSVLHMDRFSALTDREGHFAFSKQQVDGSLGKTPGKATLELSAQAPGYAKWVITGARYLKGDTLRLYPRLPHKGQADVSVAAARMQDGPVGTAQVSTSPLFSYSAPASNQAGSASALSDAAALAPPATIRVYRTGSGQVDVVPFRDYVKHVLPNEWIPTWHPEALRAGAIAVKMYAWYWVSHGGKQQSLAADVKDNVEDQVYDPNVSYASTDAAVDATFDYVLRLNGQLFQTQYCAGSYGENGGGDCPWSNLYMTQWGSAYHADHGKTWGWIIQYYYSGAVLTPAPPGGGYTGPPPARATPTRVAQAPPAQPPAPSANAVYAIGQGSDRADLFKEAYDRNGGAAVLGKPLGPVRWWLSYVTEFNVHAQHFSGSDGRGNIWIVYDTLKASSQGVHKAFVLTGDIAATYSAHTPPGPEWLGAPTSDPYVSGQDASGVTSQGFTNGTLSVAPGGVQYTPWPETFNGWKAEYFVAHDDPATQAGASFALRGQPSLVKDVASPGFDWSGTPDEPASLGVGKADWSVQFTKEMTMGAGSYDFVMGTSGGLRLWVDGVLAIDSWQTRQGFDSLTYHADLSAGSHRVRIQYFSPNGGGKLQFDVTSQVQNAVPPTATTAPPPSAPAPAKVPAATPTATQPSGQASLRIRVAWLGRGPSPSDRWVLPLALLLSSPGNPGIVGTYHSMTDPNGVAFFNNLPAGIFDVHVKGPHSLQSARASIGLQSGSPVDLDMQAQVEGDLNGDNCVTPDDLAAVQNMLGASKGTPGFDASADLNGDGVVSMADLSLLRSGMDRCGDISADNAFHIMSTNSAPSLAEVLAPWMDPASLQHTLTIAALPSAASVKPGSIFSVAIMAQAGSQPVDGAAFVLHYDPQRLTPVDAAGAPTSNAEPGLLLPAVMGDWIDPKGGAIGYSSAIVQGEPPSGRFTLATIRFKASGATGPAEIGFEQIPSPYMQLTNGGENLLAGATGTSVLIQP